MPNKKIPLVKAWSYSRYDCYQKCPALFKYRAIERRDEPKGEALLNGIKVHEDAEKYLKREIGRVPPTLNKLSKDFSSIKKIDAIPEEAWTLTKDWTETGWFDADAWLRIKVDAHYSVDDKTLKVIDFKTGKIRLNEGYEQQLELYAVGAFAIFDVERVETELWFVDHGVIYGRGDNDDENQEHFMYEISEYESLVKVWKQRIKPMFNDTRFDPTPNYSCKWCHFSKANGGPCKF
jgi:hypothetical protein